MKSFTHVHSSSRFDRSPMSLYTAAVRYNTVAELVTYTEVTKENREEALKKANNDTFGMVEGDHGPHDDSVICYKKGRFRLIHSESFVATSKDYDHAGFDLYATIAVFEDRVNRRRFVVSVTHLPAHLEADIRNGRVTDRTKAWNLAFDRVRKRCNTLKKTHKASGVMMVADYNINFKKSWVRKFIRLQAPYYEHTWKKLRVRGGTHGKRIIDATLVKGRLKVVGTAVLMVDDESSDHRPYKEVLTFA